MLFLQGKMSRDGSKKLQKPGYRKTWETNPILRDWIESVPDQPDKAYCKFCRRTLYAHKYSVFKHTCTIKHQQNSDRFKLTQQSSDHEKPTFPEVNRKAKNEKVLPKIEAIEDRGDSEGCKSGGSQKDDYEDYLEGVEISQVEHLDEPSNQVVITTEEYLDMPDGSREDSGNELQEHEEAKYAVSEEGNDYGNYTYEEDVETSSQNQPDMSGTRKTISTHILDTTQGRPAANVPVALFQLVDNKWKQISHSTTNNDGRVPQLVSEEEFTAGCYKIHFDVSGYFRQTAEKFLYPFIEIAFQCETGEHYHIPLLLNPFGYSTYRGS